MDDKQYVNWLNNFLYSFLPSEKYSVDFYQPTNKLTIPPVLGTYKLKLGNVSTFLQARYQYFISNANINVRYLNSNTVTYFGQTYILNTQIDILGMCEFINGFFLKINDPSLISSIKIKYNNIESNIIENPQTDTLLFSFPSAIYLSTLSFSIQIIFTLKNGVLFTKNIYLQEISISQIFNTEEIFPVNENKFALQIDNQPPLDVIRGVGVRVNAYQVKLSFFNPNEENTKIIIFRAEEDKELLLANKEYELNENINGWQVVYIGESTYFFNDYVPQNISYLYKIFTFDQFFNYSTGVNIFVPPDLVFGINYTILSSSQNITVGSGDEVELFKLSISSNYFLYTLLLKLNITSLVFQSIKIYINDVLVEIINELYSGDYYYNINIPLTTTPKDLKFIGVIKNEEYLNAGITNSTVSLLELRTSVLPVEFNNISANIIVDNYIYDSLNVTTSVSIPTSQVNFNIQYTPQESNINFIILKNSEESQLLNEDIEDHSFTVGDFINRWQVIYIGSQSTYTDTVTPNEYIYYAIAAFDQFLNYTTPIIKEVYIDTVPPNPITYLSCGRFNETNSFLLIEYNNISSDAYKLLIFRSLLNTPPLLTNGVNYTSSLPDYDLIFSTTTILNTYNINDTTLPTVDKYYYYVYVADTSFNYSTPVIGEIEEYFEYFIPLITLFYDPISGKHYVTYERNNQIILDEVIVV